MGGEVIEKRINWHKIHAEYVAGGISQRKLAKKYNIPWSTLEKRAAKEKWASDRDKARTVVEEKAVQETAEEVVNNAVLAEKIKRKGLETLDRLFDEFASVTSTEHRDYKGLKLTDIKRLRDLTAAYKDLTEDIPKAENKDTMEKLDAMLAEVRNYASNA